MRIEFLKLAEDITELANRKPILYVSYDGNWGDALIRKSTLSFFNNFGIEYTEIKCHDLKISRNLLLFRAKIQGQLVVLAGGGAWCGHYNHAARIASTMMRRYNLKKMLVLPSTYDREYNIKNTTFYCRDRFESQQYMPNAVFCHDMAFFLEDYSSTKDPSKPEANCFREDIESRGEITLPDDNFDISGQGNVYDNVYQFFNYLSDFEVINTDRLHVSIAASFLKKKVNLFEGSYFKNRAIYYSSLSKTHPNTNIISKSSDLTKK